MIKKLLNPNQNAKSALLLTKSDSPCCGDTDSVVCEYTATNATAKTISSITLLNSKGVSTVVPSGAYTNIHTFKVAASAAIRTAGYAVLDVDAIKVTVSGNNWIIKFVGEAEITLITNSDASTAAITKECTPVYICDFVFRTAGSATTSYTWGTTSTTLNFVYGTQTASQTKTLIENASSGHKGVTVVADTDNELFVITIKSYYNKNIVLGGVVGVKSNCTHEYE